MANPKNKTVVAEITRGFRYKGMSVMPAKPDKNGKVTPRLAELDERFAMQLQNASKVKICTGSEKANFTLPKSDDIDEEMEALAKA